MRLSEKTIETTVASELSLSMGHHFIWFGLTQKQERRAGFDLMTNMNGRPVFLQFKASNHFVKGKSKRFITHHHQLQALIDRSRPGRDIYYVLPEIGTTHEIASNLPNLLRTCWLLNVSSLPKPFPAATGRGGRARKSQVHYIDLDLTNKLVTIHSNPVRLAGTNFLEVVRGVSEISAYETFATFQDFEEFSEPFKRNAACILVLPKNRYSVTIK